MTEATEYETTRRTIVRRRTVKPTLYREPVGSFDILGGKTSDTVLVDACVPRRLAEIMKGLFDGYMAGTIKI